MTRSRRSRAVACSELNCLTRERVYMESMLKPSDRFSVSPGALFHYLHGEIVILDMTSDAYFGLNSSGAFIWESLSGGSTIEETAMNLANRYPVEIEQARR